MLESCPKLAGWETFVECRRAMALPWLPGLAGDSWEESQLIKFTKMKDALIIFFFGGISPSKGNSR